MKCQESRALGQVGSVGDRNGRVGKVREGLQFVEEGMSTSVFVLTKSNLYPACLYILIITLQNNSPPPRIRS